MARRKTTKRRPARMGSKTKILTCMRKATKGPFKSKTEARKALRAAVDKCVKGR